MPKIFEVKIKCKKRNFIGFQKSFFFSIRDSGSKVQKNFFCIQTKKLQLKVSFFQHWIGILFSGDKKNNQK